MVLRGAEVYPVKRLLSGVRYNISFGNRYKRTEIHANPYTLPLGAGDVKSKKEVPQFFIGYKF